MSTKLDDLDLVTRRADDSKGTITEIRSIKSLGLVSERNLVDQKTPSAYGSTVMDKGGSAAKIAIEGEFVGDEAVQGITELRKKYKEGEPLEFVSDLAASAGINKVLIEELHIEGLSGLQSHFRYHLLLRQYTAPPQQEGEDPPSQDQKAEEEVEKESEVDDIRGQVLDGNGDPVKEIKMKISGPTGIFESVTDENGFYEVLGVPEGEYEITSDVEGYQDLKKKIEVKKGTNK